jgi:hypothetical protein
LELPQRRDQALAHDRMIIYDEQLHS